MNRRREQRHVLWKELLPVSWMKDKDGLYGHGIDCMKDVGWISIYQGRKRGVENIKRATKHSWKGANNSCCSQHEKEVGICPQAPVFGPPKRQHLFKPTWKHRICQTWLWDWLRYLYAYMLTSIQPLQERQVCFGCQGSPVQGLRDRSGEGRRRGPGISPPEDQSACKFFTFKEARANSGPVQVI